MEKFVSNFEPLFSGINLDSLESKLAFPFFTNIDRSVYAPIIAPPELIGALCSRTSRASGDLREVFVREFVKPFLKPERFETDDDASWKKKQEYAAGLSAFIGVLRKYGVEAIFNNPKARQFYSTWLAQYGDDSIAQMAGTHLVFSGISQVALKHLEDQRIGLAPIEKSTRYVDYSARINGTYRYYVDPTLKELGLTYEYSRAMDGLFDTYAKLLPKMQIWLQRKHPEVEENVCRAKALDVLRGLLPCSTLSQVAFFGNGQAFEYLVTRSSRHPLGEIRWAAMRAQQELEHIVPAFLRRLGTDSSKQYQKYVQERVARMDALVEELFPEQFVAVPSSSSVLLVEWDPDAEAKIATGLLYEARNCRKPWNEIFEQVRKTPILIERVIEEHFQGRTARWVKVGRALENAHVRFEIMMDIGAYRDLHRHRMHTQQRQLFSCSHGYDTPSEVIDAGFGGPYRKAIEQAQGVYADIAAHDTLLAQYAVPLAQHVRFQQYQNLRAFFWEAELRTIPEGHPNYRRIEQEKFRLLKEKFPVLMRHVHVDMGHYEFARRGQAQKIAAKERELDRLRGDA